MFVDATALLSGSTVSETFFLFDDSPASKGKGTSSLSSACYPGQLIRWYLTPIDVQTPVWINAIQFHPAFPAQYSPQREAATESAVDSRGNAVAAPAEDSARIDPALAEVAPALSQLVARIALDDAQCGPWGLVWSGYVPAYLQPDQPYHYGIQFVFGGRQSTAFAVDGPSLIYPVCSCAAEEASTGVL
jgi:hypothetical protein